RVGFVEQVEIALHQPLRRELFRNPAPAGLPKGTAPGWILDEQSQLACHHRLVARWKEAAADTVGDDFEQLGQAPCHDRLAGCLCLQTHVHAAAEDAGYNHNVCLRQMFCEIMTRGNNLDLLDMSKRLQLVHLTGIANEDEPQVRQEVVEDVE